MFSKSFFRAIFLGFIFFSFNLTAQEETIYYNAKWMPTVKDSASFYRPAIQKEGDLYRVKDYYISGKLQMSGLSKSNKKDIWHGKVTWLNEDGSLSQEGKYKENRLEGEFSSILNKQKLVAIYKNGYYLSGKRNTSGNGFQMYMEKEGDSLKEIFYESKIGGIRVEYYGTSKTPRGLSKFYGKDGVFIGEEIRINDSKLKGLNVAYYYNPMRVQYITYYRDGYSLGKTVYYENGQVREKFTQKPSFKKEFFKQNGVKRGEITYSLSRNYLKPEDGAAYSFYTKRESGKEDAVKSIMVYEDEKLVSRVTYHPNGKKQRQESFTKGTKDLQVSYNESGDEIARIDYINYVPSNGVEISGDRKSTYKAGELINLVVYYPKTKTIFSQKIKEKETYYSKEGETLGSLVYNGTYLSKPLSGKRFTIDYKGNISRVEEYENGLRKRETNFVTLTNENKNIIFKEVVAYGLDGFSKIKEAKYYSNGQKQSEITFEKYKEQEGVYYSQKGEVIGNFNFLKDEGVFYDFFNFSNDIKEFKEQKFGVVKRSKRYEQVYNNATRKNDLILIVDIDTSCCGKFYSREGVLVGEVTFKDGKPFKGQVYDYISRQMFTLSEGKKNGIYQKLSYTGKDVEEQGKYKNDLKEGAFKYFDYKGNLTHTEIYVGDKLEGKAVYFDTSGNVISFLIYKNGVPFEGKKITGRISNGYGTEEFYKNGKITQKIEYKTKGNRKTIYTEDGVEHHIQFLEDNTAVKYDYEAVKGVLNGEVKRFNKAGEQTNKAVFDKGKLVSGKVLLKDNRQNYGVAYMTMEKEGNKLIVEYFDENKKRVFKAEEMLAPNSPPAFINKLNIYLDYINDKQLY